MMLKLSLTSIKKRWQDYLVLLMGLMIAIAIFYMFQTLSLNSNFLEASIPSISIVAVIFQFGAFLLAIITIIYLFYANSFLLSMRKKEYGMYLMLGAKKNKIGQMIAIETLFIGLLAIFSGVLLGTACAKIMSQLLFSMISVPATLYAAFVPKALLVTAGFFTVLFSLTTIVNVAKFKRTQTLDLLYSDSASQRYQKHPLVLVIKIIIALILIGIGYFCMIEIARLNFIGMFVAIITITSGTFLFFNSLVPVIVEKLKGWSLLSSRGIQIFTLSQLSFKATALANVLGLVTMLLALSLGAVTVGQAFKEYGSELLNIPANDLVSYQPTPAIQKEIDQLKVKEQLVYHSKDLNDTVYLVAEEFAEQPLLAPQEQEFNKPPQPVKDLKINYRYTPEVRAEQGIMHGFSYLKNSYSEAGSWRKGVMLVPNSEFVKIAQAEQEIQVIRVADYTQQLAIFKNINELEKKRQPESGESDSKYAYYLQIQGLTSGFMFMGFFLGFAFLAMLASCLMFKILTGAYQDVKRYDMLHKIGASKKVVVRSIRQEILAVFMAPVFLGVVHVLVGLKMFVLMIPNPYAYIIFPFTLFGCVYLVYYGLTVKLYKKIVLRG